MTNRDPERALLSRLAAACVVALLAVPATIVAREGHASAAILILGVLAAPFALFAVCGLAYVSIEGRGVRFANAGRALFIRWEDIERFSLRRHGPLRRVGVAELRGGRRVALWGIQGPNAAARHTTAVAEHLIGALNAELRRRRPPLAPDVERGSLLDAASTRVPAAA